MSYQRIIDFSAGVGGRGEARFFEDEANGKNYVAVLGPEDLDVTYPISWPSSAPAAGNILEFDASGTATFIPTPVSGAADLQAAYDAATTDPQITPLNADPVVFERASGDGQVFGVRNAASTDVLTVGTLGMDFVVSGATLLGVGATELELRGDPAATLGTVRSFSPFFVDDISPAFATNQFAYNYNEDFSSGAGVFVGGALGSSGTVDVDTTIFVYLQFDETKIFRQNVGVLFSNVVGNQFRPTLLSLGANPIPPSLGMNVAPTLERDTAGAGTAGFTTGLSLAPLLKASLAGATATVTSLTGISFQPTFSTVAGSTAAFGTLRGLRCVNPAPGFFEPSAGAETLVEYIGVEIDAIPFGGNVTKRGIRSALAAASATMFIEATGTAASSFAGNILFNGRLDINSGIALGGGAAATLGTIGGSGPTAAAQAQWVEIDIGGVAHWLPAWT